MRDVGDVIDVVTGDRLFLLDEHRAGLVEFEDLDLPTPRICCGQDPIHRIMHSLVVFVLLVIGPVEGYNPRLKKRRQIVHVTICVLVVEEPLLKPDDDFHAQSVFEYYFDLFAAQIWVSVWVQQTFLSRNQCSLAVHMYRAPFQHNRHVMTWHPFHLTYLSSNKPVFVPREITSTLQSTPSIKLPVNSNYTSRVIHYEGRTRVPDPGIISGDLYNAH
mmetsp:Transcript_40160/g.65103  ORF Transcript_40160/g.65103 Transcript_40160/m.65103 type:complete len:217 (-) Transcript_40160:315-965(-)